MAWLLDLDGVVWLADVAIPGSVEAVSRLRDRGTRVLFVTNNSSATLGHYRAKLARMGLPTTEDDIITSAQAAASLLRPAEPVLVCAGEGVAEAVEAVGATVVDDPDAAAAVVVGWHRDFDFARLTMASRAVWSGARLIGTNDDPTYPTPNGPLPGGGSILAAVAYATDQEPVVAGKPHQPMADLVLARAGRPAVFVGDRPSTDGLMAARLGVPFVLVATGVTESAERTSGVPVAHPVADLAAAVELLG